VKVEEKQLLNQENGINMQNKVYSSQQIEQHLIDLGLLSFLPAVNIPNLSDKDFVDWVIDFTSTTSSSSTWCDRVRQCVGFSNRSIGDLFRIVKNYHPDISFERLFDLVIELIDEGKVGSFICADIGKRVYFTGTYCNGKLIDEFHNELPDDLEYRVNDMGYSGESFYLQFINIKQYAEVE
jgi:hypothetical protein